MSDMLSVYLISSSKPDPEMITKWLQEWHKIIPLPDGPLAASLLGAKRCYRSFDVSLNANLTQVRNDWVDYYHNILLSGHGSVLEHTTFTFAIEGISRVCTAELNRHRAGVAISEASGRYIVLDDNTTYYVPDCLSPESLVVFHKAMRDAITAYKTILSMNPQTDFHGKKAVTSAARRVAPIGLHTGGVWTFNLRALIHILQLRSDVAAEEEIRKLARLLFEAIPAEIFDTATVSENGKINFPCGKI